MTQLEALMKIAKRNGNLLTPAAVIAEARSEKSVLHGAFTWDDTVAAEKWRVCEAQKLIRECRVTIEEGDRKVETYAFVGISTDRTGDAKDNPYRIASYVANDESLLAVAERDAVEQLKSVERRYNHLKRLNAVWDAIAKM